MSQQLIGRSPDLKRLRDEGYDLALVAGHIVVRGVPYVTAARSIARGTLVSTLQMQGDAVGVPDTHVMLFAGEYPCHADGTPLEHIRHGSAEQRLAPDLVVQHSFSAKPLIPYPGYYAKFTTYVQLLASPAYRLDPSVTSCTFPVVRDDEGSPFHFVDTSSSRAGITAISARVAGQRIAIVGLGGTGSYVLDFVAKTPVREIHLIDADIFCNHNAFRSPGAATVQELEGGPAKAAYYASRYGRMHRGIQAHVEALTPANLALLDGLDFVFLCLDDGVAKRPIIAALEAAGTPFVDVGLGVREQQGQLAGKLRVTAHSAAQPVAASRRRRIPMEAAEPTADYATNIQIAELNALNAAMAVIRWKKHFGFYADTEREHHSEYVVDWNVMINADQP